MYLRPLCEIFGEAVNESEANETCLNRSHGEENLILAEGHPGSGIGKWDRRGVVNSSIDEEERREQVCDSEIWPKLPDELVDRVLSWLPPSSIFRFRVVCKRWNSLVFDRGYLKLWDEASFRTPSVAFLDYCSGQLSFRYCEFMNKWYNLPFRLGPFTEEIRLLAVSGGLLCFGLVGPSQQIYVCNILTRNSRVLPSWKRRQRQNCTLSKSVVSLVVDEETKAYKVVIVSVQKSNCKVKYADVYESRSGLWFAVPLDVTVVDAACLSENILVREGVLHWNTIFPAGLSAFDVAKGSWKHIKIKLPRLFVPHENVYLIPSKGSILLVGMMVGGWQYTIGVWKLVESPDVAWVQMTCMPSRLFKELFLTSNKDFQCFGQDNFICFSRHPGRIWLILDISTNLWRWGADLDLDAVVQPCWCYLEPSITMTV